MKLEQICAWKEIIKDKHQVEGYQRNCLNCDGYDTKCDYYFVIVGKKK